MWSTWYRKSRVDLRQRWLQVGVLAAMLVAGTTAVTLAFTVDRSTTRVFDRVLEEANAPHLWLYTPDPAVIASVPNHPAVEEASQQFALINAGLIFEGESHGAWVWGVSETPRVSPGLLTDGRWVDPARTDEVVVGTGLAREAEIALGDRLLLVAPNSRAASYEVVGVVTPTVGAPYPQWTPATVFISQRSIEAMAGGPLSELDDEQRAALNLGVGQGVRLVAPDTPELLLSDLPGRLSARNIRDIRTGVVEEAEAPAIMLRIFAIFSVIASGFVVAATIGNHAMAQQREIGLLKAIGLTPRQTTTLLVAQLLAVSVPAAVVGIAIGIAATPQFQWSITELLDAPAETSVHVPTLLGVFVAVQLLVVASATLPARRAGGVRIVEAIATGPRRASARASLLARAADGVRLPEVVIVGVKDTFTRPLRSWLTIAAIAVAAATLMMAFSFRHSLQRIVDRPGLAGSTPYELQVARLGALIPTDPTAGDVPATVISYEETAALVAAHPDVEAFFTDRATISRVGTFNARTHVVSGDIQSMGFELASGRLLAAPNEAVLGLGLAQDFGLDVGDRVIVGILPGRSVTMTVVGTYFTEENAGDVLMYGLDTLLALDPSADPGEIGIKLVASADVESVVADLVDASDGRIVVTDLTREADANIGDERRLVAPMTLLSIGLAGLAAANLLSSLVFSVHERTAEFGILKAVGFTPRQVVVIVMAGVAPLALLGTLIGAPVGFLLLDFIVRSQSDPYLPSDLVRLPPAPWIAMLVGIALMITFVGSLLPALRAGRLGVSAALRAE